MTTDLTADRVREGRFDHMKVNLRLLFIPVVLSFSLIWLWPFRPLPLNGFTQEVLSFSAALIVLLSLLTRKTVLRKSFLVFLGLAFIPLLQYCFGLIPFVGNAWLVSVYLFSFALMLSAGYSLSPGRSTLRSAGTIAPIDLLAVVFVLAAALSTWIALRQYFHLADSIWEINHNQGRPYANLAQPNNLATLLGLGLAGCLYLYEKRLLGRVASGVLVLFLIMGIAVTQSRTPWVTSLAILVFWYLKKGHFSTRLTTLSLFLWVLVYAGLVLVLPQFNSILELGGVGIVDRAAKLERWDLWAQLWFAATNGPFWGYGWNQTASAQLAVTLDWPLAMYSTYSHNIVLDFLLWNGFFPGLLISVIITAWLLRLGWYARSTESLFALIGSGFILAHSMLEFPFAYAYFLLPLGLLLGVASADLPGKKNYKVSKYVVFLIILLGVILLRIVITDYQIIKSNYVEQRMRAANVVGFESDKPISDVVFLTQFRELQRFRATVPQAGVSAEELDWMQLVVQQYPHLANLYRYSLILALNGRQKDAEMYMQTLCNLHGQHLCDQAKEVFEGDLEKYRVPVIRD